MKTIVFLAIASLALAADPEFNKDGDLVRPKNYREWIFLSSGVGMSYGAAAVLGSLTAAIPRRRCQSDGIQAAACAGSCDRG